MPKQPPPSAWLDELRKDSEPHAVEPIEVEVKPAENAVVLAPQVAEGEVVRLNAIPKSWAGVKVVWECSVCGEFRDSEDDCILHVMEHAPKEEKDKALKSLLEGFAYSFIRKEK